MNHLWNLIRKELKELMTPASVISILVVALIFGSMGSLLGSETDKLSEPPVIGVLTYDDTSNYDDAMGYIDDYYKIVYEVDDTSGYVKKYSGHTEYDIFEGDLDAAAVSAMMNGFGVNVLLVFDKEYLQNIADIVSGIAALGEIRIFWNEVDTGVFGSASSALIGQIVSYISLRTAERIVETLGGGNAASVLIPVAVVNNVTVFDGRVFDKNITPADISGALQSQSFLMPILIMIIITMIGSMIISSMGNEKENKTLETLLTLPVKRTTIVSGKLMGSAIAGLIFGIAYLIGMYFYTNSVWNVGALSLSDLGLTLTLMDWAVTAAMIFLAILSALGICMILGAFVKNYKAAQTLTLPISVLAMIPMFVTMFTDFNTLPALLQGALFAIPFTHPMMVMNNLMLGNSFMVWAGLGYLALFSLLTIYITVRIYNSDILLTGLVKKGKKRGPFSVFSRPKS